MSADVSLQQLELSRVNIWIDDTADLSSVELRQQVKKREQRTQWPRPGSTWSSRERTGSPFEGYLQSEQSLRHLSIPRRPTQKQAPFRCYRCRIKKKRHNGK